MSGPWWVIALGTLAACGRLGFDPLAGDDGTGPGDDGGSNAGDGGGTGDSGSVTADAMPDAQPAACATAFTVQVNVPYATSTCAGNNDRIDACGPNATNEVVFKVTPATTRSYTIRARDAGTQNVSNSTAQINPACTTSGSCAGVTGIGLTAGQTYYFIVEASSGSCANIEFDVI
jgi:hypothetical protein